MGTPRPEVEAHSLSVNYASPDSDPREVRWRQKKASLTASEMVDSASPPTGGGGKKQVSWFHKCVKILEVQSGIIILLSFGFV